MHEDEKRDFWDQAKETTEETLDKLEEVGEILGEKGSEAWEATADARRTIVDKANEIRDVVVEKTAEAWDEARRTASAKSEETAVPADGSEDETDEYPAYGRAPDDSD